MGKIKKLLESELIGGDQDTEVYPVTSTKAVYDGKNRKLEDFVFDKNNIVSELGNSENLVISQKYVSQEIIQGGVYDVSAHNNNAVFESLQALLSSSNLSTLIPPLVRHGGMSIKFIQGSVPNPDNKYMQYRLTNQSWSINIADWQEIGSAEFSSGEKVSEVGIDDEPTAGSNNLVRSGGVKRITVNIEKEINGFSFETFEYSEGIDGQITYFGYVPKLSLQPHNNKINKVWIGISGIGYKLKIFAATYEIGKTSAGHDYYSSVTPTRIADLIWNEEGWYDTDINIETNEVIGFVCLTTATAGIFPRIKTDSDVSRNMVIQTAANANNVTVGNNVRGSNGPSNESIWFKVEETSKIPRFSDVDGMIKSNIVDNLSTESSELSLSANQGFQLNDKIAKIEGTRSDIYTKGEYDSTYNNVFGFVPCPQVIIPINHIDRVWLDVDISNIVEAYIIAGTYVQGGASTYYNLDVTITKKVIMSYNSVEGCFYTNIDIADNEIYGFLFKLKSSIIGFTLGYKNINTYKSLILNKSTYVDNADIGKLLKGNAQRFSMWYAVGKAGLSTEINKIKEYLIKRNEEVFRDNLFPNFAIGNWSGQRDHDCTIVNNKFWSFQKTGNGGRCSVSDMDGTYHADLSFTHRFTQDFIPDSVLSGYAKDLEMKSVDYWDGKLVVGNGCAAFNSEGTNQYSRLFIFYDVENWVGKTETITFNNCGDYTAINLQDLGHKCYGAWAGKDTIFVSINFFDDIYSIQLGKGSNDLSLVENGHGIYAEVDSDKYNGTYRVIDHWTNPNPQLISVGTYSGVKESWHGGQFYNGHLYIAPNDPSKCCVYRFILGSDTKIRYDVIHLENYGVMRNYTNGGSGYLTHNYIDGVCIDRNTGKLYAQALEGSGGKMIIADI